MLAIDAVFAILYAVDNGAKVAYFNFPKGGFPKQQSFWGETIDYGEMVIQALQYAESRNVLVVIPAGNDGNADVADFLKDERLQQLENVLVVAGLGRNGQVLPWSNSGVKLAALAAPAEGMLSYFPGALVSDGMATSSIAAAYVTGAAALIATLPGYGRARDIRSKLLRSIRTTPQRLPVLSGGPLFLNLAP
jgi:subtilisin family serine protease